MPDVNLLIYAHRQDERTHEFYRGWLEELVNGEEPFALSPMVAVAFVRIVTHPGFPPEPTPLLQALTVIESLRERRGCRMPSPTERHWSLVRRLCEETGARGKLVADAAHAALAMEYGCTWVTRDADFARFRSSGLRVEILEAG